MDHFSCRKEKEWRRSFWQVTAEEYEIALLTFSSMGIVIGAHTVQIANCSVLIVARFSNGSLREMRLRSKLIITLVDFKCNVTRRCFSGSFFCNRVSKYREEDCVE